MPLPNTTLGVLDRMNREDRRRPPMVNGRYVLPDVDEPDKTITHQRVTNMIRPLTDPYTINAWSTRMTVIGLQQPAMMLRLAELDPTDRDAVEKLAADAKKAAGGEDAADIGTLLHGFYERHLRGEADIVLPPQFHDDLYGPHGVAVTLDAAGIAGVPELVERFIVHPELGYAGQCDAIVSLHGALVVLDWKTGGWSNPMEWAAQIAAYAMAPLLWVPETNGYVEMPPVDQALGLVAHVPAGSGTCTLIELDLAAGREAVALALDVLSNRRNTRRYGRPFEPPSAPVPAVPAPTAPELPPAAVTVTYTKPTPPIGTSPRSPEPEATVVTLPTAPPVPAEPEPDPEPESLGDLFEQRHAYVVDRRNAMKGDAKLMEAVAYAWPVGLSGRPSDWRNDDDLDRVIAVLDAVDARFDRPFGPTDPKTTEAIAERTAAAFTVPIPELAPPWPVPPDGPKMHLHDIDALKNLVAELDVNQGAHLRRWSTEAKRAERPFDATKATGWSKRTWSIARAATLAATHFGGGGTDDTDLLLRLALSIVLDGPINAEWTTGGILGSLDVTQADAVANIASTFDDPTVAAELGKALAAMEETPA